jgi:hypothetical protein
MYKTSTKTVAVNTVNAITLTSPNAKYIFLKQYLVALMGTDGPANSVTIQITDEDSNVLWEDGILIGVTSEHTGGFRVSHTFPGKGLMAPANKNLIVTVSAAGAATSSELSLLYDI